MKKIISLFMTAVIFSAVCIGQEKESVAAKSNSTELMINGKPYSQYKAEQEALKKQQELKNNTVAKTPEVPEQFRLKPGGSWNAKPVTNAPNAKAEDLAPAANGGLNGQVQKSAVTQDPSAKQTPANNTPVKEAEPARVITESSRNAEQAKKD